MAALSIALALLLITAAAQPSNEPTLTPLGAQQLYSQGAAFRSRYLRSDGRGDFVPIVGISPDAIDNSQLNVSSSTDSHIAASAMAFMQGLYPPRESAVYRDAHSVEGARLASHSVLNYPLRGYQYPRIRTISHGLDPDSIWVQGGADCPNHAKSQLGFGNDSLVSSTYKKSRSLYSILWDRLLWPTFHRSQTNFHNAYKLYDYAASRWIHDNETRSLMTPSQLATLRLLASAEQVFRHANLSAGDDAEGGMLDAIAGRTLAARVPALLAENIASRGARNKLNLVFTSHEPFLAFFALARPGAGPPASRQLFSELPYPGAAMAFELFSDARHDDDVDDDDAAGYPPPDRLRVRFLYRNSTDPCARLASYPLFGSSAPSVPFDQFDASMSAVGIGDAAAWCRLCESAAAFCTGALPREKMPARLWTILLGSAAAVLAVAVILLLIGLLA